MRKSKRRIDPQKVLRTCAWCGKRIPENSEIFSFGAKAKPGIDLQNHEGSCVPLYLTELSKIIYAIVTTGDSQAKRDGNDLVFTICSRRCGESLKTALQEEQEFLDGIH